MVKNLLGEIMVKKAKPAFDTKGLVEKIESGYITESSKPTFKTKKTFSPSTLVWGSGACPRYWHLAFSGAVFAGDGGEADPKSIARMLNGTVSHERLQKAIKNAGILHSEEVKIVNNDPPIFGYCDIIVEWEGQLLPGEIKTVREEAFEYRKNSGVPAEYHLAQILFYMRELKQDLGFVMYESKNSHELLILPVVMTDEYRQWLDDTYEWMRTVRSTWVDGGLAKKPYRSNSKVCKGCPLIDACKQAKVGTVSIDPLKMVQ